MKDGRIARDTKKDAKKSRSKRGKKRSLGSHLKKMIKEEQA
jgi:hypothetical protein